MAFIEDIIFPTGISRGSRGGPGFNHSVFESDTGEQNVISRWPRERRSWNARYGVRAFDDLRVVHNIFLAVEGISNGFRWQDIFDYTTALDGISAPNENDAVVGQGDNTNVLFQLVKTYTVATTTHVRAIEKPVTGTVLVALNAVIQTEGVDYTIDYSTGTILFAVAPTVSEQVTCGCRFHVPVQFGASIDPLLDVSVDGWRHGQIPDIPIIEMVGQVATPRQPYRGGGSTQIIGINTAYDYAFGHAVAWVPTAAGTYVVLPAIDDLPAGMPIFHFENGSGTNALDFRRRETGALEFTLPPSDGAMIGVRLTGATTKNWIALLGN